MIRGFLDRLMGTVSAKEIETEAQSFIRSCGEVNLDAARFKNDIGPAQWWAEASPSFRAIANSKSKQQQALALRRIITSAVDEKYRAAQLLSAKMSPGDVAIASKGIGELKAESLDEIFRRCSRRYILEELTIRFARYLAGKHFEDARDNDYLRLLEEVAGLFYQHYFEAYVANEKGERDLLEMFLPSVRKMYDDAARVVLSGGNYDTSNHDANKESEASSPAELPPPPKLNELRGDQIDALAHVLEERYERLQRGTLYVVDGYPPKKPLDALIVDGGMMLSALHERCSSAVLAEESLRRILVRFARFLSAAHGQATTTIVEDVNIEGQRALCGTWKDKEGEGSLGNAMIFAAMLLFDITAEQFEAMSSSEKKYVGEIGAKLINDAWEVYAKTRNVLGESISETFLQSDRGDQSPNERFMFEDMQLSEIMEWLGGLPRNRKLVTGDLTGLFRRLFEIAYFEHGISPREREQAIRLAEGVFSDIESAFQNDPENLERVHAARRASEENARRFGYGSLFWLKKEQNVPPEATIPFMMKVEHGHLLKDVLETLPKDKLLDVRPEMVRELIRTRQSPDEKGALVTLQRLAREKDPATLALFSLEELNTFENAHRDASGARAIVIDLGLVP